MKREGVGGDYQPTRLHTTILTIKDNILLIRHIFVCNCWNFFYFVVSKMETGILVIDYFF